MMTSDKRPVLIGEHRPTEYNPVLTYKQAMAYAKRMMPDDLYRAGFKPSIFASDPVLHGGLWYRVNWGKAV